MANGSRGQEDAGRERVLKSQKKEFDTSFLADAAFAEVAYLRELGSEPDLMLAAANLGGYEALLLLIAAGEKGVPVYELITSIQSRFTSQSGVVARVRAMRDRGLIQEQPGRKKSQVYLVPSDGIRERLGSILTERHGSRLIGG